VQPVGAHDQVEAARLAPLEADLDAVVALGELGDGVVEEVLHVVAGGLVEAVDQVPAQDLQLGDGAAGVTQQVGGHAGQPLAGGVDVGHAAGADVGLADLVQDAHAVGHATSRPAQVDGLPAGAWGRGPLHHRWCEPVAAQPVGQGRSGDARAGDEDLPVLHVSLLVGSAGSYDCLRHMSRTNVLDDRLNRR
jgi:hypothetical protein